MTYWSSSRTGRATSGPITLKPANSHLLLAQDGLQQGVRGGARANQRFDFFGAIAGQSLRLIREEINEIGFGPELSPALSCCVGTNNRKGTQMRPLLLAAILIAAIALPAQARVQPVKGAVQGTATAATGVARGAGQVGLGVVRGTGTAVRSTARGLRCFVTLGNRC